MSDKKKPKPTVRCMDCVEIDMVDMFCISKGKDILDPYREIRCSRFIKLK